jgi:hypothetical protein
LLGGFNARHVGHGQIQQNYVRFEFSKFLDSIFAILSFAANRPVTGTQNRADNTARNLGVINNQYSKCFGSYALGQFVTSPSVTAKELDAP